MADDGGDFGYEDSELDYRLDHDDDKRQKKEWQK